ncbi:MAG: hypothetical protein KDK07_08470 [Bauldia sp.]|nr:hypothetical protein [Bauldia sp.]
MGKGKPSENESDGPIAHARTTQNLSELVAAARVIAEGFQSRPKLDERPDDEILGYDDFGVFERTARARAE